VHDGALEQQPEGRQVTSQLAGTGTERGGRERWVDEVELRRGAQPRP
jgi:hypothetical protein